MSRIVEFDENAVCENCGSKGAFDFPWAACLCESCCDDSKKSDYSNDSLDFQCESDYSCEICGSYFLDGKRHPRMCQFCLDDDGA